MAKEDQPVTIKILNEAVDAILVGMENLVSSENSKLKQDIKKEMDSKFNKVDKRFDKIEAEIHFIKDDLKGLRGELAGTVSKKEFNNLKSRVDKYHPLS